MLRTFILLVVACLAPACSVRPVAPAGNALMTAPPVRHFDGSPVRVNLLARSFLVRDQKERSGFAYYAYMLFADRSDKTAGARRSAAIAFMRLLEDVHDAPGELKPENMAVLYAPINSASAGARCLEGKDPQVLLDAYDYPRARLTINELSRGGRVLPAVALVGYPRPIDGRASIDSTNLWIVDMSSEHDDVAQRRLLEFRDALESGAAGSSSAVPEALQKARWFFQLVGTTLSDWNSVVAP
jgi:hypothetical protein